MAPWNDEAVLVDRLQVFGRRTPLLTAGAAAACTRWHAPVGHGSGKRVAGGCTCQVAAGRGCRGLASESCEEAGDAGRGAQKAARIRLFVFFPRRSKNAWPGNRQADFR
jgi:hypothetical protein